MQDKIWKGFVLAFACCVAVGYVWLYLATNAPAEAADNTGSALTVEQGSGTGIETETEDTAELPEDTETTEDDAEETSAAEVTVTMPEEFVNGRTQAELEADIADTGCSVTLNSDGTATYEMTEAQRTQLLEVITEQFETALNEMAGSTDYPGITSIATNGMFSSFTVRTTATAPEDYESTLSEAFCQYAEWYALLSGEDANQVIVEYINVDTDAVVSSFTSGEEEDDEAAAETSAETVTETTAQTA